MLQLELDKYYLEAADRVAKSHNESRRQYWKDYICRALDSVPGLMDKVREDIGSNYAVPDPKVEMGHLKEVHITGGGPKPVFKDQFNTEKWYRFTYLDKEKGFVDGYGKNANEALENAMGRPMSTDEYYVTFKSPPGMRPS